MLRIFLRSVEIFNEDTQEFESIGGVTVDLEHSLYTVSKWEEIHKKSFAQSAIDFNFIMSYLPCMSMTENIPDKYWACLTHTQLNEIVAYIQDPHTATTIRRDDKKNTRNRTVTAELIYYWMISLNIPIQFEHWHFNKLMTLIQVCTIESAPKPDKKGKKKPLSKNEMQRRRELNAMRRAQLNTKG